MPKKKEHQLSPLAIWLNEITDELDISLTALASKAGLSPGTLRYLIIEPERRPSLETCLRLSALTGKPVEEIIALGGGHAIQPADVYHPDRLRLMELYDAMVLPGRRAMLTVAETLAESLSMDANK